MIRPLLSPQGDDILQAMQSRLIKIIVEKHGDGYVAYPLGLKGAVVAEGDSFDQVVRELQSAIRFHIETFGEDVLDGADPIEAFVAETSITT